MNLLTTIGFSSGLLPFAAKYEAVGLSYRSKRRTYCALSTPSPSAGGATAVRTVVLLPFSTLPIAMSVLVDATVPSARIHR